MGPFFKGALWDYKLPIQVKYEKMRDYIRIKSNWLKVVLDFIIRVSRKTSEIIFPGKYEHNSIMSLNSLIL